jgi:hypothetical protein
MGEKEEERKMRWRRREEGREGGEELEEIPETETLCPSAFSPFFK